MSVISLFLVGAVPSPQSRPLAGLMDAWGSAGIHVVTHDYDESRSDDTLVQEIRHAFARACETRGCSPGEVAIAGFSRGARLAAMLARHEEATALLCLGFPFHKRGAPQERHGLDALSGLQIPTLIVQGSRDAHGSWEEVRGYTGLPECIRLHWLEDGNHRWHAREKSVVSDEELMQSASAATIEFLGGTL